jgi:hypothetical protein
MATAVIYLRDPFKGLLHKMLLSILHSSVFVQHYLTSPGKSGQVQELAWDSNVLWASPSF